MVALRNPTAVSNGYSEMPGDGETLLRSGLSLRHMRMIVALALITIFPGLVLYLPRLMGYPG